MTPPDLTFQILQHMDGCARQLHVRALFAVEAGCWARGTAAPDSSQEVRYVYVRSAESYASPWVGSLATEMHGVMARGFVCTGTDLRQLVIDLADSKPDVIEWLQSPMSYRQYLPFTGAALALLPESFRPALAVAHYRQRAWSIQQRHLVNETVWPDMYLSALGALLAASWVERHATPPPLAFDMLLHDAALPPALHVDIQQLLLAKRSGAITDLTPPDGLLDDFICQELQRELPDPFVPSDAVWAAREALDRLFLLTLRTLPR